MKIHTFIAYLGASLCLLALTVAHAATDTTAPTAAPAASGTGAIDGSLLAPVDAAPPVVDATGNVTLSLTPNGANRLPVQYNLARWYAGSAIVIFDAQGEPRTLKFNADERALSPFSSLLDEDSTIDTPFGAGTQQVVINLNGTQTLQKINFYSSSTAGTVDIYYSNATEVVKPGSPDWKSANVHKEFAAQQTVSLDVKAMDAHYVMLSFNITQPGGIGSLAIFGNVATAGKGVAPKQQQGDSNADSDSVTTPFDYGPSAYGSRITHVAGGPVDQAQLALDGDPTTGIPLGGDTQKDKDNILVVDLGASRDLNKLGVLFKTSGKGKFEFYLLNDVPTDSTDAPVGTTTPVPAGAAPAKPTAFMWPAADGKLEPLLLASASGSIAEALVMAQLAAADDSTGGIQIANLPANFFKDNKPAFAQDVTDKQDRISIDMKKVTPTRFVMLRWVPSTPNQPPIEVFEVNLIGTVPMATFVSTSRTNANRVGGLPTIGVQVAPGTPGFIPTTLSTTIQTPSATQSSGSNNTPPPPGTSTPPPPPGEPSAVSP